MTGGPPGTVVRIAVSDREHAGTVVGHPETYEVTGRAEVGEVLRALGTGGVGERDDFVCMCPGPYRFSLYDAAGRLVRTVDRHDPLPLLDPADPESIPGRHRAAWAAAAPAPLRRYAAGWARGEAPEPEAPGPEVAAAPLSLVFGWLGAPSAGGGAAARVARLAPLALLGAAATDDLAWAVRQTDAAGLDGAVEFFASEHFTARHPRKRRVGTTSRELVLRHARVRRPEHVAVLERRLLRAAEDRIRR
ncbi:hypothetical protein ACF068_25045 [Streptomyces sp. NPDC016309]|uniref:hypothetical protein n=1 Tax=Streptomyces sp. NPDC016309 TaxID=3364965 RepID=UPI0036F9B7F5